MTGMAMLNRKLVAQTENAGSPYRVVLDRDNGETGWRRETA